MTGTFVEYRDVTVSDPLRQGDVLEAVDEAVPMWRRHLVVITADCDFAHEKHQGRVTCVPLLSSEEYLLEVTVPKVRHTMIARPLSELVSILRNSGAQNITSERVREWISEEDAESIAAAVNSTGDEYEQLLRLSRGIRLADTQVATLSEALAKLTDAQQLFTPNQKREKALNSVLSSVRTPFAKPPGDVLFLSAFGAGYDGGYFAYLRHLEQIWESQVSTKPTRRPVEYRRVARLRDRFIHVLVQQFALVFMPIGLPAEYEETRKIYSELVGEGSK